MRNCVGQLGAFSMAIVFGKIVDVTHSYNAPILFISGVLFPGGLLWLFINSKKSLALASIEKHSAHAPQLIPESHYVNTGNISAGMKSLFQKDKKRKSVTKTIHTLKSLLP